MTPSKHRCPELPSWCPDFNSLSSTNSFGRLYTAGHITEMWDTELPLPHSWGLLPSELNLRGLTMDRVKHVECLTWEALRSGRDVKNAALVIECEEVCSRLSKQVYKSAGDIPAEHMITLVAGMQVGNVEYPTDQLVEDYGNTIRIYHALVAGLIRHDEVDQATLISVERYQGAMDIVWKHSCFFTTETGRIGIGADTVQPGDAICVIFKANTPFVLRPNPQGDAYQFCGAAYIHGLMDGVAFTARNPIETYQEFLVL